MVIALAYFFITYWFISIFIYLTKKTQYSTYTRIIQRFWKRALWLFWLIELFLFSIYLFLAIISPQEVSYMLDNSQLISTVNYNYDLFFNNIQYALYIILLANILILAHKYNTLRISIYCLLFICLIRAIYEDTIQFFTINQFYNNFLWTHTKIDIYGVWEQEISELKTRTIFHYVYLLIFLKLWHTLFIFSFFLFFENIKLHGNDTSFNILSSNLQNFYFLFFFNFILKFFTIKTFLNYLGTYVYFWFFINPNSYDFGYIYHLIDINYFVYLF